MNPSQLQAAINSTQTLQDQLYTTTLLPSAARAKNDNTLHQTYRGIITTINQTWAFTNPPKPRPITLLETELRFAWRIFTLAAKCIDADHPGQDRLTWLILWTREMGVLSRTVRNADGETVVEQAVTSQGRIWIDLPFVLQDVQREWTEVMRSVSNAGHCRNLTAAIARLAAVGVLGDAFSGCGLGIMRQALETSRNASCVAPAAALNSGEQDEASISGESGHTLPLLLPLVQPWLHYAGRKLLQLSVDMVSNDSSRWRIGFESDDTFSQNPSFDGTGFSIQRLQYWKDELTKLGDYTFEDAATKETAMACSRLIDNVWNEFFGVRLGRAMGRQGNTAS